MYFSNILSNEFKIKPEYALNIINLINDENTIPFIARYRKELTGGTDDQLLRLFADRYEYLKSFLKRKEEVFALISESGNMTDEIEHALNAAVILSEIEDIYRPFKKKRKTRASAAKEKGLDPLANAIFAQLPSCEPPLDMAKDYINIELGVKTEDDALAGALDIIAELISDNPSIRKRLRYVFLQLGILSSKAVDLEKESVYSLYYDFNEPVSKLPGHRILAINRGEREEFLKVNVMLDEARVFNIIESEVLISKSPCTEAVRAACKDAYDRLIAPSVEREIRNELTERASTGAIKVFADNLRQLLMQPPVKGKTVLGLDPGYRTGCKIAAVDKTGRVLHTNVIYPAPPHNKTQEAEKTVLSVIKKFGVEIIDIGNGTASKETELFVSGLIKNNNLNISYTVVSEAGASVYSASKLASEEFPQFDVSIRSAVSIARRLQDPLAELVKIDPKAIGIGQYQHDMPPKQLDNTLCGVVEDCVNSVGVDLNTASPSLLSNVAGIGASVAKEIVQFREANGEFTSRTQLKKVPKLGPKAFEQCAGFLRISESKNILDNTGVHPESYPAAKELLSLCDIKDNNFEALKESAEEIGYSVLCEKLNIGEPTLIDIINEITKPGRDPRDELPAVQLRTDILDIADLKPGMELSGTVRNVIDFGAFVDIGVHQDGLVHISQLSNNFIKHPSDAVKVGDVITVYVMSVDVEKKRISLTCKKENIKTQNTP